MHPDSVETADGRVATGEMLGVKDLSADQDVAWAVKPEAYTPTIPAPAAPAAPIALGTPLLAGERVHALYFSANAVTVVFDDQGNSTKPRLVRVELATAKAAPPVPLPADRVFLDLTPDGALALTRAKIGGVANILEVFPATAPLKPGAAATVQWKPYVTNKKDEEELALASFVDANHVLTADADGTVILWQLPSATAPTAGAPAARPKAVYRLKLNKAVKPLLAPGRGYFLARAGDKLRAFDALSGGSLGSVTTDIAPEWLTLGFDAAGKRLAISANRRIGIVDLTAGRTVREIPLPPTFGSGTNSRVAWLTGGYLLFDGRWVVSPAQRLVTWEYQFPQPLSVHTAGESTWYVAPSGPTLALCAAKLPHDAALRATPPVKVDDLMVFRRGDAASIEVNTDAPADIRQKIVDSLTRQVTDMGMTVGGGGTVRIVCSTKPGETRNVQYRVIGRGFATENVSVTEKIHKIEVIVDGKPAFSPTAYSGASMMVSPKEGQTIAAAVADAQTQSYNWFATFKLPRELVRPEGYKPAGTSVIGAKGAE
jgi:hypothetical protein